MAFMEPHARGSPGRAGAEERAQLRSYLEAASVSDLMRDGAFHADPAFKEANSGVVSVDIDDSVEVALQTLREHHILSAPVRDREAAAEFVGSVDTLDLLHTILTSLVLEKDQKQATEKGGDHAQVDWAPYARSLEDLSAAGAKLRELTVRDIMDASKLNAWSVVNDSANVFQLVDDCLFKLHRAGVSAADKADPAKERLAGIVSQMDVLHFITDWMVGRNGLPDETIGNLGLGTESIVSMSIDAPAVAAFFLMLWNKVSAVAIVDSQRRLVANLSATDIVGIHAENIAKLALPVREYLSTRVQLRQMGKYVAVAPPQPAVTIKTTATFSSALFKLSTFRLHRVWIVDDDDVPVGCLSISDVMRFVQKYLNEADAM